MLLSSFHGQYDMLNTALEARKEKDLTLAFVQQKILVEYERQIKGQKGQNVKCQKSEMLWQRHQTVFCVIFVRRKATLRKTILRTVQDVASQSSCLTQARIETA